MGQKGVLLLSFPFKFVILILSLILHLLASYLQVSQSYFAPYARMSILVIFIK